MKLHALINLDRTEEISYRNYLFREGHREELLERERKRRKEHHDEINARRRKARQINPEKFRLVHRKWYAANRAREILKLRQRYAYLRLRAIEKLGGKCIRCGFSDKRVLQIDHINGGGRQAKKTIGQHRMYREIIEKPLGEVSKQYQCLCANCNWIKKAEREEVVTFKRNLA